MEYVIDAKTRDDIAALAKQFPNDQDLGKRFRGEQIFHGISMEFPNDQELGRELRKISRKKNIR